MLPEPGALFDQDSYLMYMFREVFEADIEREEIDNKKQRAEAERLRAQAKQKG